MGRRFRDSYSHLHKSPRSWPEDFHRENGNYLCRCVYCGHDFIGHKRRCVCRLCAQPVTTKKMFIRFVLYFGALSLVVASGLMFGFREIIWPSLGLVALVAIGEIMQKVSTTIRIRKQEKERNKKQ